MEKNETLPQQEEQIRLNPDLQDLLNAGLTACFDKFNDENIGTPIFDVEVITNPIRVIEDAIAYSDSEPSNTPWQIREQRLSPSGQALYINISPSSKIDRENITVHGTPSLDLSKGPVDECKIVIRPFSEDKTPKRLNDPSKTILQGGYFIKMETSRTFLDREGKIQFKNLAGIDLRIYKGGTADSSLKYCIGMTDFNSKAVPLNSAPNIGETISRTVDYLSGLI
jgi:hypothetical protein